MSGGRPRRPGPRSGALRLSGAPLSERELDELQELLDAIPAPLEPFDVSSLDGFLCGVLVQPERVPRERWLAHVGDADGRPLPAGHDASRLHGLVLRRAGELEQAIAARRWFDPWVFELEPGDTGADASPEPGGCEAVVPWVAGFAAALATFPSLVEAADSAINVPLALLYRHLDPDDLEDADALLDEIAAFDPPEDLAEAVQDLVRATFLLADEAAASARPRR